MCERTRKEKGYVRKRAQMQRQLNRCGFLSHVPFLSRTAKHSQPHVQDKRESKGTFAAHLGVEMGIRYRVQG